VTAGANNHRVRKTPSWPSSWANFEPSFIAVFLLLLHGPTGIFWANVTPFSLTNPRSRWSARTAAALTSTRTAPRPSERAPRGRPAL
jgi:hypothetical protein